jgi:thiamine pyrophosphate-dependent acetolactate synthase large subunit-like protein
MVAAALAALGRAVVSLTGDGGCNMMLGELETARRLGVALALVVAIGFAWVGARDADRGDIK